MELATSWDSSLNFPSPLLRFFIQDFNIFWKKGMEPHPSPLLGQVAKDSLGWEIFTFAKGVMTGYGGNDWNMHGFEFLAVSWICRHWSQARNGSEIGFSLFVPALKPAAFLSVPRGFGAWCWKNWRSVLQLKAPDPAGNRILFCKTDVVGGVGWAVIKPDLQVSLTGNKLVRLCYLCFWEHFPLVWWFGF